MEMNLFVSSQITDLYTLDKNTVDVQLQPVEILLDTPDDVVYLAGMIELVLLCLYLAELIAYYHFIVLRCVFGTIDDYGAETSY